MNQAEFQASNPYAQFGAMAVDAPADVRLAFIRKTYIHLAAAIYAFVALEFLLFSVGFADWVMPWMVGSQYSWLFVLGAFMGVSWIANKWALSDTSVGMQYAGLFFYVLAEAVIFVPLLMFAQRAQINLQGYAVDVIPAAGVTTLIVFGGLTAVVFFTRKDFSFLGAFLGLAGFGALALIVISILFGGFQFGVWFSGLMVILACGYILYYTSNILHHYRTTQHVAAALALFAAVALLFYYILMIFLRNRD
jgi:FtsH-binding integral membrane protein